MLTKACRGMGRSREGVLTEVGGECLDETAGGIFGSGVDKGDSEGRAEARVVEGEGGCLGTEVNWVKRDRDSEELTTLTPSDRIRGRVGTI